MTSLNCGIASILIVAKVTFINKMSIRSALNPLNKNQNF